LGNAKVWPALLIRSSAVLEAGDADVAPALSIADALTALLDDFAPAAIHDLADLPLPPGGLWDPTFPPPPDPPPSPLHWRVFFSAAADRDAAFHAVHESYAGLDLVCENVSDEDWAARSQQSLAPVHAGRFVVAPPWNIPSAAHETVIVIEPSRGFGTGHHASTRLCLRAMSDLDLRGKRVLDLGTGSGVLAMAAFLSGAREVVAVDVDPDAIDSARQSAKLNPRVGPVHWLVGDFRDRGWEVLSGGGFDVVLANLTGGMLVSSAARVRELLRPDGLLICSGFDLAEKAGVEAALRLRTHSEFDEEGWVGLILV
jgi:ribosomal protein L11 methyltransferase